MSPIHCLDPDRLDAVMAAPEDDSRRRHARECPRCGALLESYRLYLEASGGATSGEIAEAESRMSAALARELDLSEAAPQRPTVRRVAPERERAGWFGWLQPTYVFASLVAVAAAIVLAPRLGRHEPEITLRGDARAAAIAISRAAVEGDRVKMSWNALPGVTSYDVRFYSVDLAELGRVTVSEARVDRPLTDLGLAASRPQSVMTRVIAIGSDGREIHSAPRMLDWK